MPHISLTQFLGLGFLVLSVCVLYLSVTRGYSNMQLVHHQAISLATADYRITPGLQNITSINQLALPPDTRSTVGRWLQMWQPEMQAEFDKLVEAKVEMDDPKLISLIRKLLIPPSPHQTLKISRAAMKTPQIKAALEVLQNKRNGFFIECGALDGERSSNTFFLEKELGWTGLLVEMDPYFFLQLLGRSRKSWSLNACLSPTKYANKVSFKESSGGLGKLSTDNTGIPMPCFPLYSLLLALNRTHVDFFSLDVEGFEMPIMQGFPWDKIDISVLTVEYAHGDGGKEKYKAFMTSQGYSVYKDIHLHDYSQALFVDDLIFVKNGVQ